IQLVQHQRILHRTHNDYILAPTGRPTSDGTPLAFPKSGREQSVWLGTALIGRQVVRRVEIDRVHRLQRNELVDVHTLGTGLLERLDFLRSEHHVLILSELIALDDLVPPDDHPLLLADILLLETGPVLLM